jgi:hypothetical protein
MTLLGRIFTLLVLLLSVAFFMVSLIANSTHIDHKKKLAAFQTQAKQLETTNEQLKTLIEQLQTSKAQEQAARRMALSALQTQLESSKEQLAQATKELNDKAGALTAQTQQLGETHDRVAILTRQNEAVKAEIDKIITDRNEQRRKAIDLTDRLNNLQSVEQDLRDQIAQLQKDSTLYQAKWETAASALKVAGIKDPDDVPPPGLKGEVLSVGTNQVVVSVGKDDGLREGHYLEVYRGGTYLARIEIQTVQDDKALGKVLTSFRKGYIQAGDKVAAKVN